MFSGRGLFGELVGAEVRKSWDFLKVRNDSLHIYLSTGRFSINIMPHAKEFFVITHCACI